MSGKPTTWELQGVAAVCTAIVAAGLIPTGGANFSVAAADREMRRVEVAPDGRCFRLAGSNERFIPWGFNYDHDETGRLLEDYWDSDWHKVVADFQEMKRLGANVVRIHLQVGRFLPVPDTPAPRSLAKLKQLLDLARQTGLYLDLTGLGCYHRRDVPAWYDTLEEESRWAIQVRFWEAIARTCAGHPAVWCYDLMNEPVIPGGKLQPGNWLGPEFGGKCFVQFITLDPRGRAREEIGEMWVRTLVSAIRRYDTQTLITVGLLDGNIERRKFHSGFDPKSLARYLDFLSLHIYPKSGEVDAAVERVGEYAVGKPLVIEEMFPLNCTAAELEQFVLRSRRHACGWIGFYWGKTPEEYQRSRALTDRIALSWLELFQKWSPAKLSETWQP